MTKRDDGGPAFPQFDREEHCGRCGNEVNIFPDGGITARDYFAARAPPVTEQWMKDSLGDGHHWIDSIASWSYAYADAMLEERKR